MTPQKAHNQIKGKLKGLAKVTPNLDTILDLRLTKQQRRHIKANHDPLLARWENAPKAWTMAMQEAQRVRENGNPPIHWQNGVRR